MAALSKILRSADGGGLMFHCPGCNSTHMVRVGDGPGPRWGYNGNPENPTFTPSILLRHQSWVPPVTAENLGEWQRSPWPQTKAEAVCHSFVTDGRIQFLGDCTHHLAGQTVDLPPWPGETD